VRLRIVPVGPDTVSLWRDIHNAVIPAHHLTSDDGLAFAGRHGFVESDRYVLDGETEAYVDFYLGHLNASQAPRAEAHRWL
jgi:hypothetical protein